uniref:C2H2-type domain-containing protein n=1 Tax=Moniliophthora roreri TaxID=221103 RepID=A0A0W0FU72_MONRR
MASSSDSSSPFWCKPCKRDFKSSSGLMHHNNTVHREIIPPIDDNDNDAAARRYTYIRHTHLTADPCDIQGTTLPPKSPPPKECEQPHIDTPEAWAPFASRTKFDFAHFHFTELQASEGKIDKSLDILHAFLLEHEDDAPFTNCKDLYTTIDSIQKENTPWKSYQLSYSGEEPENAPNWMTETYTLCMQDVQDVITAQL